MHLKMQPAHTGSRSFCVGIVLDNDKVSFWFYDAAGYVSVNTTLSLFADFEKVIAIIVGFGCLTHEQWGAIPPIISPPAEAQYPAHFPPKSLAKHSFDMLHPISKDQIRVTLTKPVFTQYSLVGRRTFVYNTKTNVQPLVVKIAYQVVTRKPEHEIVALAKEAGVEHFPEVHMWCDLWKLSDGTRRIFYDLSLEMSKNKDEIANYEDRIIRALVYTKYQPLKTIFSKSWKLIPELINQMLDCKSLILLVYVIIDLVPKRPP